MTCRWLYTSAAATIICKYKCRTCKGSRGVASRIDKAGDEGGVGGNTIGTIVEMPEIIKF